MAFLFKKKPADLCKQLIKCLDQRAESDEEKTKKAEDRISENLVLIREMLYGTDDNQPKIANIQQLRDELTNDSDLLIRLLRELASFDLKTQKEIVKIVTFFLVRGRQNTFAEYFLNHPEMLEIVLNGCANPKIAAHCAPIVRECIVHKELCAFYLTDKYVPQFFEFVQQKDADLASNAFLTLRSLLCTHKSMSAKYLDKNYEAVFDGHFIKLLKSDNFVTQIKTLELIRDILLEKRHLKILVKFTSDLENLKLIMEMLRIKKVVMQFAVYDVFKLFLANKKKTKEIAKVLIKNRDALRNFLEKLQKDGDAEFEADKRYLFDRLDKLDEALEAAEKRAEEEAASGDDEKSASPTGSADPTPSPSPSASPKQSPAPTPVVVRVETPVAKSGAEPELKPASPSADTEKENDSPEKDSERVPEFGQNLKPSDAANIKKSPVADTRSRSVAEVEKREPTEKNGSEAVSDSSEERIQE